MGLFTELRPEENDDWAGIPSDPLRAETEAERLRDAAPVDAAGLGLGGFGDFAAVESILIPVAPVIEIAESQETGEGVDDDVDDD
jgi:hypothetical protein